MLRPLLAALLLAGWTVTAYSSSNSFGPYADLRPRFYGRHFSNGPSYVGYRHGRNMRFSDQLDEDFDDEAVSKKPKGKPKAKPKQNELRTIAKMPDTLKTFLNYLEKTGFGDEEPKNRPGKRGGKMPQGKIPKNNNKRKMIRRLPPKASKMEMPPKEFVGGIARPRGVLLREISVETAAQPVGFLRTDPLQTYGPSAASPGIILRQQAIPVANVLEQPQVSLVEQPPPIVVRNMPMKNIHVIRDQAPVVPVAVSLRKLPHQLLRSSKRTKIQMPFHAIQKEPKQKLPVRYHQSEFHRTTLGPGEYPVERAIYPQNDPYPIDPLSLQPTVFQESRFIQRQVPQVPPIVSSGYNVVSSNVQPEKRSSKLKSSKKTMLRKLPVVKIVSQKHLRSGIVKKQSPPTEIVMKHKFDLHSLKSLFENVQTKNLSVETRKDCNNDAKNGKDQKKYDKIFAFGKKMKKTLRKWKKQMDKQNTTPKPVEPKKKTQKMKKKKTTTSKPSLSRHISLLTPSTPKRKKLPKDKNVQYVGQKITSGKRQRWKTVTVPIDSPIPSFSSTIKPSSIFRRRADLKDNSGGE